MANFTLGANRLWRFSVPVVFYVCRESVFYRFRRVDRRGVLAQEEVDEVDFGKEADTIDYEKLYHNRYPLLRKAYERSKVSENAEYNRFVQENEWWLKDYALFMAVKERFGGIAWTESILFISLDSLALNTFRLIGIAFVIFFISYQSILEC